VQKAKQVYYQIHQTTVGKKEINNNTDMRIYKMVYLLTLWLRKLNSVNKT